MAGARMTTDKVRDRPRPFRGFRDMLRFHRTLGVAAATIALCTGIAAQAAPSCWQDHEVSAARMRQMQTMLMVATLRCRAAHLDISEDYNAFMTAQGATVSAANLVIKQHFAQAGGTQADYDHFATSLANGYGDDETDQASCADAAALAHEAMAATEAGALDRVAAARLFPAAMPGGMCSAPAAAAVAAAAAPKPRALPPVLAVLAPAPVSPTPAAVSLPDDVVAALTVMARFRDKEAVASAAPANAAPTLVAAVAK